MCGQHYSYVIILAFTMHIFSSHPEIVPLIRPVLKPVSAMINYVMDNVPGAREGVEVAYAALSHIPHIAALSS